MSSPTNRRGTHCWGCFFTVKSQRTETNTDSSRLRVGAHEPSDQKVREAARACQLKAAEKSYASTLEVRITGERKYIHKYIHVEEPHRIPPFTSRAVNVRTNAQG